jgi:hypothetical protein
MADLKVIALSCTMEALGIDSENLLWSKIRTEYPKWSQSLICRTRFNRRRRMLRPCIERLQQSGITKGNVHDINFLNQLRHLPKGKFLLGGRAYRSSPLQMELFDQFKVKLKVPFKINQTGYRRHPRKWKSKRQMLETFFAQMCDQFHLKRNYSKSYDGLVARLTSKLSAI